MKKKWARIKPFIAAVLCLLAGSHFGRHEWLGGACESLGALLLLVQ